MKKVLAVSVAFLLVAGFGAAMNKGELIDRIASDADLTKADAKRAIGTFWQDGIAPGQYVAIVNDEAGDMDEDILVRLIVEIQEDDKIAAYDPPTLDTGSPGGEGDAAARERATENGRKTVQPRDLVILASGHGDNVSDAAATLERGVKKGDTSLALIAVGHGDDVKKAALSVSHRAARKGRNPQTGRR